MEFSLKKTTETALKAKISEPKKYSQITLYFFKSRPLIKNINCLPFICIRFTFALQSKNYFSPKNIYYYNIEYMNTI